MYMYILKIGGDECVRLIHVYMYVSTFERLRGDECPNYMYGSLDVIT